MSANSTSRFPFRNASAWTGALILGSGLLGSGLLTGCPPADIPAQQVCEDRPDALRASARPVESLAVTLVQRVDAESFETFIQPLFGDAAKEGNRHNGFSLSPSFSLFVDEDARSDAQVVLRVEMVTSDELNETREIMRVPASFALGSVYIDAIRAAFAETAIVTADGTEEMGDWSLTHKAVSANGGLWKMTVDYQNSAAVLRFEIGSPETSLSTGQVNSPARVGEPYETIGGTVWFGLGRDEFDFFSQRAYGTNAGADQNFRDFQLLPHKWLRLTVTPQFALGMVDIGFELVTIDGRRIPVARAPASYAAGEQYRQNVLRLSKTMREQEDAAPGSSSKWVAPFVYQDPEGGGIVKVIAQGENGKFRIAYTVESPVSFLDDVTFLPYQGVVDIPEGAGEIVPGCPPEEQSAEGRFVIRFRASSTVANSADKKAPLVGNVWGSIYRSDDVTILGPNDGAQEVANFSFTNVDIRDDNALRSYEVATDLPAGDYQVLGFMDIDDDVSLDDPSPNTGDPVMIPIGGYPLNCPLENIDVEFALLLPEGY